MDRFLDWRLFAAILVGLTFQVHVTAQTWKIPDRGVVFYQRNRSTTGSGIGSAQVEMPALLFAGELDRDRKAVALSPADVRDLGMWLAFDLRIGNRKFRRTVHTIIGLAKLEIQGRGSTIDADGVQMITAQITSRPGAPAAGRRSRAGSAGLTGTLEIRRTIDRQRGLVTKFRASLKGDIRASAGGGRGFGGGRRGRGRGAGGAGDEGGVIRVRDRWTLDRVERNREPRFRTRVADAIRRGAVYVKSMMKNTAGRQNRVNPLGVDMNSGTLALCLLTLLKADVSAQDPDVARGFTQLRRRNLKDTYSIAVSLMAMEALYAPLNERQLLIEGRIKTPAKRTPSAGDMKIIQAWTTQLLKNFDTRQRPAYLLRFNYVEGVAHYDNSNTQYALLGLYSAHLCAVPISATVWFANAQHWLQDQAAESRVRVKLTTTSHRQFNKIRAAEEARAAAAAAGSRRTVSGGSRRTVAGRLATAAGWPYIGSFGSGQGTAPNGGRGGRGGPGGRGGRGGRGMGGGGPRNSTASMTTAGLTGVTICQAVLGQAKKGGKLLGKLEAAKRAGLAWLLHEFSVRINKNNGKHYHYYLYGLERACEMNQIALIGNRDWYFEGANMLVETQIQAGADIADLGEAGRGGGRMGRDGPGGFAGGGGRSGPGGFLGAGLPQTCMAILFLKQSAPPLPVITHGR